jgi:hypothetical protein
MIIRRDCPWIRHWKGLLGKRPWQLGMLWKKIFGGRR